MYWDYAQCEKYLNNNPSKPLIQCEYAHAMGNSMGGLDHYWKLVRQYPSYQGGFIWDFVDQGLARYEKNGRVSFLYGGDFNNYDATDNSFNCNGIIAPDRTWHPHAYEVKRQYQNIWTELLDPAQGRVEVYNENFFVGLDDYELTWELVADGRVVKAGRIGRTRCRAPAAPYLYAGLYFRRFLPAGQGAAGERGLQTEKQTAAVGYRPYGGAAAVRRA